MSPETSRFNGAIEIVTEPVIRADETCEHIMSLHLDPRGDGELGILRCIITRTGSVQRSGFVDRSQIHTVEMESPYRATRGPELDIRGTEDVVSSLADGTTNDFIGLEDPNIWCSYDADVLHLYCTIPFIERYSGDTCVYLGHAEGEDIYSLTMTEPVLKPVSGVHGGAKEVAIAPQASDGNRYNLVESNDTIGDTAYSVLRTTIAPDLSGPWEYGDLVFHPALDGHEWCGGHVSPGPFLPREFLDVGEGRIVGLLNGREANRVVDGEIRYGEFAIGLMVYDYENADVEWVSEKPFIRDPDAVSITFASAFRQTAANRGLIYAHIDDSYVRVYRVDADSLSSYLP